MGTFKAITASFVMGAMFFAQPAAASQQRIGDIGSAEQLRRLDIMLMVTSLRCRTTGDDFSADYDRFATAHLRTMNAASQQLRAAYASGRSARAQNRALDTISTAMANRYGTGHPWLACGDLRGIARELAAERDVGELLVAANDLLADRPPARASMQARYMWD